MRAHHGEPGVDQPALALADLVHSRLHVVVDPAPGHPAECREAPRVRIEQHLVTLARVGHQPERPGGTQLHVGHLQPVVDAAHQQPLLAPVELERLAQLEAQRHERPSDHARAFAQAPRADEVRHPAVAPVIARSLDLRIQRTRRTAFVLRTPSIGLERLLDRVFEAIELLGHLRPAVLRRAVHRRA